MTVMLEWIINCYDYIKLHGLYVDRGDPAVVDFAVGDLTADGGWHDLDLSSIVPAGARTVYLLIGIQDNLPDQRFELRKNGQAQKINIRRLRTQVANQSIYMHVWVLLDTDRKIEYSASGIVWTSINITVLAWSY